MECAAAENAEFRQVAALPVRDCRASPEIAAAAVEEAESGAWFAELHQARGQMFI